MSRRSARIRLPAGLIALRERNFVLYVVGQFTSQLGSWIELTAVSWIVYEMTNSPFLLGLVGLFRATPTILLALFGGALLISPYAMGYELGLMAPPLAIYLARRLDPAWPAYAILGLVAFCAGPFASLLAILALPAARFAFSGRRATAASAIA